jgi:preprotein translocase subunit YajC
LDGEFLIGIFLMEKPERKRKKEIRKSLGERGQKKKEKE